MIYEECPHKHHDSGYCDDCGELIDESAAAEAAWERYIDGECFRGGEAAAYNAEQQALIQRTLK
jgi:Fe2+ or Zn2+ uptake regulation protein